MQDIDDIHDNILDVNVASSYPVIDADANGNDIEQSTRLPTSTELSCVICWTEFSATRGVLPCGHRFCFSCIQSWADHAASSRKTSTCPLCKASFVIITKVDNAVSSDQKIYSQTVPHDDPRMGIYILDGGETPSIPSSSSGAPVCCHCSCREPEDLLERCDVCQIQRVHIFCLDPPAFPWICANCKDLQRLYLYRR
nr:RING-H2 finger protein ATL5-like isoform X1 [Coffea arabica]